MHPSEFAAVKRRVIAESAPSDGFDLDGMAVDFDAHLTRSPLLAEVEVSRTGDPDTLITARCLAVPGATPAQVAAELETIWTRHLSYRHFAAHTLTVDERGAHLEAVTRIDAHGFYVTATITAGTTAGPTM